MAFGFGVPELLIILVILLLIFGVGRLTQVGGGLGRSIREFRENLRQNHHEDGTPSG